MLLVEKRMLYFLFLEHLPHFVMMRRSRTASTDGVCEALSYAFQHFNSGGGVIYFLLFSHFSSAEEIYLCFLLPPGTRLSSTVVSAIRIRGPLAQPLPARNKGDDPAARARLPPPRTHEHIRAHHRTAAPCAPSTRAGGRAALVPGAAAHRRRRAHRTDAVGARPERAVGRCELGAGAVEHGRLGHYAFDPARAVACGRGQVCG